MKKNSLTSILRQGLLLATGLLLSSQLSAQCPTVSQLDINTGYDYNTSSLVSFGATDPLWDVTALSPTCAALAASTPPFDAIVRNNWAFTSPNARWITFLNSTYTTTGNAADTLRYWAEFTRPFRTCAGDNFDFNLDVSFDNFITNMWVDGVPVTLPFSTTATSNPSNYGGFQNVSFNRTLSAGTHTITIRVHNYPVGGVPNPHGLLIDGDITSTSGTASLTSNTASFDCACGEIEECSDLCYWRVQGNNIQNGNNDFGTLTDHDVDIFTAGTQRGIFTAEGLLGWNTITPTAYLHVDCAGNNEDGSGMSDIRFENLESGNGFILVIEEDGYVYNSRVRLEELQDAIGHGKRTAQLADEVKALRAELAALKAGNHMGIEDAPKDGNTLEQNVPNPFGKETKIGYTVSKVQKAAYIVISDLNGKQLMRYAVVQGTGSVTVSGDKLQPGIYLYSLIVDGQEIDTRRMVLTE